MKNIIVIGAGAVGISTALNLQQKGHRVTLLDPRGMAAAASYGNAGVIADSEVLPIATPGILWQVPGMLLRREGPLRIRWSYLPRIAPWLLRFVLSSTPQAVDHAVRSLAPLLARSKAAHEKLAREAGLPGRIKQVGWLKVYETDSMFHASQKNFERMRAAGVPCDYLDADGVAALEPHLRLPVKHAIFHSGCSQIEEPGSYVEALGQLFVRRAGQFLRTEVLGLRRDGHGVRAAWTGLGPMQADAFVIAAGAWSRKLASDAGAAVPLDTERGYHVVLDGPLSGGTALRQPVYWAERSLVMSPSRGRLRVTRGVEFAGMDAAPDYRPVLHQVDHVRRAVRGMDGAAVSAKWLGFRPSMPDSLPVVGASPAAPNCLFAFGHGHIGLTCAAVTGELVADLIEGRSTPIDISAFSPARFHGWPG